MEEYIEEAIEASEDEEWAEAYHKEETLGEVIMEQVERKSKLEIAKMMLEKGRPILEISEITGLEVEEINKLINT